MTFGERLEQAREARGMTRKALADAADLSSETVVYRWERTKVEPQTSTTVKLADALDVSLEWLVAGRGAMRRRAA